MKNKLKTNKLDHQSINIVQVILEKRRSKKS
jgi:hypothetical protein